MLRILTLCESACTQIGWMNSWIWAWDSTNARNHLMIIWTLNVGFFPGILFTQPHNEIFFILLHFRFYFISTEELLSILGSSEPSCVQEHMVKVSLEIQHFNKIKNLIHVFIFVIRCSTTSKPCD